MAHERGGSNVLTTGWWGEERETRAVGRACGVRAVGRSVWSDGPREGWGVRMALTE